jgi:hypothetical protein
MGGYGMKGELIFIGKKPSKKEIQIKGKPDFYDALLLSNRTPNTPQKILYQSIPFGTNAKVLIQFSERNIHLTYQHSSFQIMSKDLHLTDDEALDIFKHFAVKEGKKVAYLANGQRKPQKKQQIMARKASKKIKY